MVTLAEELPFAAVVEDDHLDKTCSSCFAPLRNKSRCNGCKVVSYCNKICQNKDWIDHKHECKFLNNYSPNIPPPTMRMIARIAMKLKRPDGKEPAFNGRVFDDLMDHHKEIEKDPECVEALIFYVNGFRKYMGDERPDPALVISIYGKIVINSFHITDEKGNCGKGLYLGLSVHPHSCIPDAHVISDGCKAFLRSPDTNKKYSKDITICYTARLSTNQDRQKKLQSLYFFTCKCPRCLNPTLDFLYNSARSICCPHSYCLLNPAAKELSCNKCGTISGISVQEAINANEEIRAFGSGVTCELQTLIEAYEKFAKILSPLNLNLLQLNETIVNTACILDYGSPVCIKYAEKNLYTYRHYLSVGDRDLSTLLMSIAGFMALKGPPTEQGMTLLEEAFATFLVSHGPKHSQTLTMEQFLAAYQARLLLGYRQENNLLNC